VIAPSHLNLPTLHPIEEQLARFASGDLPLARRAVIESHLAFCPSCRAAVAELSRAGSRFMKSLPGVAVPESLWSKLALRLNAEIGRAKNPLDDTPVPKGAIAELPPFGEELAWTALPTGLGHISRIFSESRLKLDLLLVRTPPESFVTYHRHVGFEDLTVVQGAFDEEDGPVGLGDFRHYPSNSGHGPKMLGDQVCWAIAAIQGGVEFRL
jgi:putative transcriptional regulator